MKYWLTQWKEGFLSGIFFMFLIAAGIQVTAFVYLKDHFNEIQYSQSRLNLGTMLVVPVNHKEKGYKEEWYKLSEGECSISIDLRDVGILQKGDIIEISGIGKYIVKSYSALKQKRVIEIYKPLKNCKDGAKIKGIWLVK